MERQLVYGRVPERHLRFDADDADYTELGRNAYRVVDQRGLPDTRRAGEQGGSRDASLGVMEELIDDSPFDGAADEQVARMGRLCGIARAGHDSATSAEPVCPRSSARRVASTATMDHDGANSAMA
jgi:hypothetical protein